jgi:hypothetical protein
MGKKFVGHGSTRNEALQDAIDIIQKDHDGGGYDNPSHDSWEWCDCLDMIAAIRGLMEPEKLSDVSDVNLDVGPPTLQDPTMIEKAREYGDPREKEEEISAVYGLE